MKQIVRLAAVFLALAAAPALASAQASVARACEPDQGNPAFVGRAWFSVSRAISLINENQGDPTKDLTDAIRTLTDPRARDREANLIGQQYILGQAYILFLANGTPVVVRRGDIGFQTAPGATIDLMLAADSMFTAVEAAMPECADLMSQWRQQKPWLTTLNEAINALNAQQLDSAEHLARRALILDRKAPYAHTVLAGVARARNDFDAALGHYREAVQLAGTDTVYAEVRAKSLGDIAQILEARLGSAPAAQKRELARQAQTAYTAYLAEKELDDLSRGYAIGALPALYIAAGDSANFRNIYAGMLETPGTYGERALLEAGMVATRFNAARDAARLFAAALASNAYQRDALNNLAASYVATEEFDKVLPLVARLLTIDPNNSDNYLLYVYAYGGLTRRATDARLKRAYTDSLVKYNLLSENLPVRVTFTEFSRLAAETRIRGTIENRARTSKTFSLAIELLGSDGAVIATQQVSVGPVATGQRQEFRVTLPTPGAQVAGFRYNPLS